MARKKKEETEVQAEIYPEIPPEIPQEQAEVETPPAESVQPQNEPRMPVVPPVHRYMGPMPPMPEEQKQNLDEYYNNPQSTQVNPMRRGGIIPR